MIILITFIMLILTIPINSSLNIIFQKNNMFLEDGLIRGRGVVG